MRSSPLFASLILLAGLAMHASAADLKPGDPAPDFSMPGSDGKTHSLADYKGKQAVVIAWFPKVFTGGCTKECKSMRENSKQLHGFDVAYFTASVDTPEKNKVSCRVAEPRLPDSERPVQGSGNGFRRPGTQRLRSTLDVLHWQRRQDLGD